MKIGHPFKNIVEKETSHICDHYEMTNMVNMGENSGILEGSFSELQTASCYIFNP